MSSAYIMSPDILQISIILLNFQANSRHHFPFKNNILENLTDWQHNLQVGKQGGYQIEQLEHDTSQDGILDYS